MIVIIRSEEHSNSLRVFEDDFSPRVDYRNELVILDAGISIENSRVEITGELQPSNFIDNEYYSPEEWKEFVDKYESTTTSQCMWKKETYGFWRKKVRYFAKGFFQRKKTISYSGSLPLDDTTIEKFGV